MHRGWIYDVIEHRDRDELKPASQRGTHVIDPYVFICVFRGHTDPVRANATRGKSGRPPGRIPGFVILARASVLSSVRANPSVTSN